MQGLEVVSAISITIFFRNHIRDNPLCYLCGVVVDAIHYFFYCRKRTIERQVFSDTVREFQPISITLSLFSNKNMSFEDCPPINTRYKTFLNNILTPCLRLTLKHIFIWICICATTKLDICTQFERVSSSSLVFCVF